MNQNKVAEMSTYERRLHLRKLCKRLLNINTSTLHDCIDNQSISANVNLDHVTTREDLGYVGKKIFANSLIFLANEMLANIETEKKLINKTFKK